MSDTIIPRIVSRFRGQQFFLSNFYPCNVSFEGLVYPSAEHAYQAAKSLDNNIRISIRNTPHASVAKSMGQSIEIRPDWESVKLSIMNKIILNKFISNETLQNKLLELKNYKLIEGNNWGDTFWGVDERKGGLNHLGEILMKVRDQLLVVFGLIGVNDEQVN